VKDRGQDVHVWDKHCYRFLGKVLLLICSKSTISYSQTVHLLALTLKSDLIKILIQVEKSELKFLDQR
jgi:hypothetical protein